MPIDDIIERNKQIYEERQAGATFKALGDKYGLTTERVRQIYLRLARREERARYKRLYDTKQAIDYLEAQARRVRRIRARQDIELTEADRVLLEKINNLIAVYSEI